MLRLVSASSCHTAADLQLDVAQVLLPRAEPTAMRHAVLACVANVIISVGSTILFIREIYSLEGAPLFTNQLNTGMQACVCGLALCVLHGVGRPRGRDEVRIPVRTWAELALLFTLQNLLEVASIDGLGAQNGPLVPVLYQAVVPMTLVASSALLGHSYALAHWAAAAVVLAGICLAYLPNCSSLALGTRWPWAVVMLASRVPQCLANVRCEALLSQWSSSRDGPRLVLQMGFFTALFSVAFSLPAGLLLCACRGRGPGALVADYRSGAELLVGAAGASPAWPAAAAFAIPGAMFALSEFHVLQQTSAATYFLLAALVLPIEAVALSARPVMGGRAGVLYPSLLWGIPTSAAGLALWARAGSARSSGSPGAAAAGACLESRELVGETLGVADRA